jgi:threonine/homoserine/homoserine lactone efflux protein
VPFPPMAGDYIEQRTKSPSAERERGRIIATVGLFCAIPCTETFVSFLPSSNDLILFVSAAVILLLIPGPAVLYVLTRSVDQGRKAGLASCAGIATGSLVHVLGATLGLSALLLSSAVAFSLVKYAGAAYLFYLGVKKLRERPAMDVEAKHVPALPLRRVYAQGVLVEALNPKVAIFFFAFPARGHVSLQFFALGMLFTFMGFTTDSVWALTAGSAAGWLRRNRTFIRSERYVSGTVYLGLGMATAVTGSKHK